MNSKKDIKLDEINKKIISIVHSQSDISNQELSERVNLSNSACFQRTKALKEAGYFVGFHTDLDLNRIAKNVLAYVEFTLESSTPKARKMFEDEIHNIPEFMDCLRISGDVDYICFTCCSDTVALNELCNRVNNNADLRIQKLKIRVILERTKWYLGYPLKNLKWLD